MERVRNQRVRRDDAGDVVVDGKNRRFVLGRIEAVLGLTRVAQAVVGLRPGNGLDARHREASSEAGEAAPRRDVNNENAGAPSMRSRTPNPACSGLLSATRT